MIWLFELVQPIKIIIQFHLYICEINIFPKTILSTKNQDTVVYFIIIFFAILHFRNRSNGALNTHHNERTEFFLAKLSKLAFSNSKVMIHKPRKGNDYGNALTCNCVFLIGLVIVLIKYVTILYYVRFLYLSKPQHATWNDTVFLSLEVRTLYTIVW